jgi:transcriptional regulator with XRE-family HTH domain
MTQEGFAERVGITQSYLSLIEHGHGEIGPSVLLAISREFKKSIEWLLTGTETK